MRLMMNRARPTHRVFLEEGGLMRVHQIIGRTFGTNYRMINFKDNLKKEGRESVAVVDDQEDLRSVTGEGNEEEIDYYRTKHID